jgi:PAS domain S-box-containing protein
VIGSAPARSRARDAWRASEPVPVLIVDDDASKRLALRAVLTSLDYVIVEADSAVAALRRVMAQDFAVILLDVCMPITDGFETAALIRQRKQSEATPIIFITGLAGDELPTNERYASGAVDFIFGPAEPHVLRAKVAAFANIFDRAQELARQTEEVQAQADQLLLLTEAAPVGIFQTDADNRYVYTNPRWSEITGVPAAVASGQPWDVMLGPDRRGAVMDSSAAGGDDRELGQRFELRPPGEEPRTVLLTSRSIAERKRGMRGRVGTLVDVTSEVRTAMVL